MLQRLKQSNIPTFNINAVNSYSSPLQFLKIWSYEVLEPKNNYIKVCLFFLSLVEEKSPTDNVGEQNTVKRKHRPPPSLDTG